MDTVVRLNDVANLSDLGVVSNIFELFISVTPIEEAEITGRVSTEAFTVFSSDFIPIFDCFNLFS